MENNLERRFHVRNRKLKILLTPEYIGFESPNRRNNFPLRLKNNVDLEKLIERRQGWLRDQDFAEI